MLAESHEFSFGETTEVDLKGLPGVHETTLVEWQSQPT